MEADMKAFWLSIILLLFGSQAFAQTNLKIEKLDRNNFAEAVTNVGYAALVEGTLKSPDTIVFAIVLDPTLKGWRLFRAIVEKNPQSGVVSWRALCQFGRLNGPGVGTSYRVRAIAFDPADLKNGLPRKLPSSILTADSVVLTRIR
jgi:hypothetical protein